MAHDTDIGGDVASGTAMMDVVAEGSRLAAPDSMTLVQAVIARSPGSALAFHGPGHWQRVASIGCQLVYEVPEADPTVVFLFSLFHDSMRSHDGRDPDHGARAALLVDRLQNVLYHLSSDQLDALDRACRAHTDEGVTSEPTIAVCWDADRLNLWRLGRRPDPRLLSTSPARRTAWILRARDLDREPLSWAGICGAFCALAGKSGP